MVEWKEPPRPRQYTWGIWEQRLAPFLNNPNQWGMIWNAPDPDKAQAAVSNLNGRKVKIPKPHHLWNFVSRECEVFAIYRGAPVASKRRSRKRAR